jgi:hypothetical protein
MLLRQSPLSVRGLTLLLIGMGLFAVVDGFTLAVVEEDRSRYGQVVPGVVLERLSSSGEDGTRTIGRNGFPVAARTDGFDPYSVVVRWLTTGSPSAFVVDYRYGCRVGTGTCFGRDFVRHDSWSRIRAGMPVNVRHSVGRESARLDANPQWRLALSRTAVGGVLLIAAALLSGRVRFRSLEKYIKAPAVVTGVREIQYGDEKRWRVTFSYFDTNSQPQESVDEANDPSWRVGEACIAVYRPQAPDVATLQPSSDHWLPRAAGGGGMSAGANRVNISSRVAS